MDLKRIFLTGVLGLSLACASKPEKVEEMVEVDVGMPRIEFIQKAINIADSTKKVRLENGTAFGGDGMSGIYQADYETNRIHFRLVKEDHAIDRFEGSSLCVRPINSKGFYLKVSGLSSLGADGETISRWSESGSREYAQRSCERIEASYQKLSRLRKNQ